MSTATVCFHNASNIAHTPQPGHMKQRSEGFFCKKNDIAYLFFYVPSSKYQLIECLVVLILYLQGFSWLRIGRLGLIMLDYIDHRCIVKATIVLWTIYVDETTVGNILTKNCMVGRHSM